MRPNVRSATQRFISASGRSAGEIDRVDLAPVVRLRERLELRSSSGWPFAIQSEFAMPRLPSPPVV